ncbi:membrane integrity-associated transporter subunit PqiC [Alcaligenaceae bacterium]|nr:membrane integrity-associated transporter subunit PqiC [Alcaligenaceae bacterium]
MRGAKFLLVPALAAVLAACASTPASHYYTLMPAAQRGAAPESAAAGAPGYVISVQPVGVPEQLDRLQIVITDPASTQVAILNSYLWASPLSEELRNALSDDLTERLGAIDVAGAAGNAPAWRVALTLQRFESVYGQYALQDATWQLTPVNLEGKRKTVCRASARVEVQQEGVSALVAAHQEALRRVGGVIAGQLQGGRQAVAADGVDLKGCSVL